MDFFISCDANWEVRLDIILDALLELGYREHFGQKEYGSGLMGIAIILMCRNPDLNFKRRMRLSKKDKTLYMDIMLDFPEMMHLDGNAKKKKALDLLIKEVPEALDKYNIIAFDKAKFLEDFHCLFGQSSP